MWLTDRPKLGRTEKQNQKNLKTDYAEQAFAGCAWK